MELFLVIFYHLVDQNMTSFNNSNYTEEHVESRDTVYTG